MRRIFLRGVMAVTEASVTLLRRRRPLAGSPLRFLQLRRRHEGRGPCPAVQSSAEARYGAAGGEGPPSLNTFRRGRISPDKVVRRRGKAASPGSGPSCRASSTRWSDEPEGHAKATRLRFGIPGDGEAEPVLPRCRLRVREDE